MFLSLQTSQWISFCDSTRTEPDFRLGQSLDRSGRIGWDFPRSSVRNGVAA